MKSPQDIASAFGITFSNAHAPAHAVLSKVYLLDDQYVLRARALEEQTENDFENELVMIDRVRPLVPFQFPNPIHTKTGERHIVDEGLLWTVYPQLQGKIYGPWQDGASRLSVKGTTAIITAMRLLHQQTKGLFPKPKELWLVRRIDDLLGQDSSLLDKEELRSIKQSINRITERVTTMDPSEFCFVHGDFHHANVLADEKGEISALLDLNWCHVGHPLEDLTYSFTMFISDYNKEPFVFDDERLRKLVAEYNQALPIDTFFYDMFALAALFDVYLFAALHSEKGDFYCRYRMALLREIQKRIEQ